MYQTVLHATLRANPGSAMFHGTALDICSASTLLLPQLRNISMLLVMGATVCERFGLHTGGVKISAMT
eukprot:2018337-Amphidinium_carterae.1